VSAPESGDWHNHARLQRIWLALDDLKTRNLSRAAPNAFRYADCPVALDLSFEIWFRGGIKKRREEEEKKKKRRRRREEEIRVKERREEKREEKNLIQRLGRNVHSFLAKTLLWGILPSIEVTHKHIMPFSSPLFEPGFHMERFSAACQEAIQTTKGAGSCLSVCFVHTPTPACLPAHGAARCLRLP
jgi:hypothetical protein